MLSRKAFIVTAVVAFTAGIAYTGYNGFIKKKSYSFIGECGVSMPAPKAWCNDFVAVFSKEEKKVFDSVIERHEAETGNEIAIVTIDSNMLGNCNIKDFATQLGNTWGVGKKDTNNGVLIVLCPQKRELRIANGYGVEKIITNEETSMIIQHEMLPHFREARYFEGTKAGLISVIRKLKALH